MNDLKGKSYIYIDTAVDLASLVSIMSKARRIAIDIEADAIKTASRYNRAKNIRYSCSDAVVDSFPHSRYDAVVWDGAIGHFTAEAAGIVLRKLAAALVPDGIFVGSESLGTEGVDHRQFFDSAGDLAEIFRPLFRFVRLRTLDYPIGSGPVRREAFWRCSNQRARLEACDWADWSDRGPL